MPLRPRGFEPHEVCDKVRVSHSGVVTPTNTDGVAGAQITADRVVVGGGLPEEGMEPDFGNPSRGSMVFTNGGDPVDVCKKEVDGELVVWLAP